MNLPSNVIYSCGCVSTIDIPEGALRATLNLREQGGDDVFELELVRISEKPPTFMEVGNPRPEWARWHHAMQWFDITIFRQANWKEFEHIFKPWRERFGEPLVPSCWLPDIVSGRGRFYGLWASQTPVKGRQVHHLRLLDPLPELEAEAAEAKEPDAT